ncbi:transcriptional regulator [Streptomyces sparsogenes]|uniref:transcriptional regulator n=1 Tax=Streptomyces sparsogenes TaxID=67365 RepID=UPI0038515758
MGFGKYGAKGMHGATALAIALDRRAFEGDRWKTPEEKLRRALIYLTRSGAGYRAMEDAGITADARTLSAWLSQMRNPNRDRQARLEAAYQTLRRRNIAPALTRQLNANGGTRIEIYPVDEAEVDVRHQRGAPWRHKNVYRWNPIVAAWSAGDGMRLATAWEDIINDLDSDWRRYEYVSHIGMP